MRVMPPEGGHAVGTAATRREFAGSTVVGHVDTKSHNHAAETSTIPPSERGRPSSVVIAGAGIIGLTTAWRLRRRGIEVTVLDDAPVSGASFAAAGMLAPVSEVVWDQPTLYPLMVESGRIYRDFAAAIAHDVGHDIGYLESSTFVCAGDSADRQTLNELLELQHRMGMTVNRISVSQARAAEPALGPGCVGVVDIPGDHQVDPRRLCGAILEFLGDRVVSTRASEVLFNEDHRAIGLRGANGKSYRADHVVLAAGVDTGAITGIPQALTDLLRPVRGEVLRLRVPEALRPLVTRTIRGVVQGNAVYIVPRADGTIVLGATTREDDMVGVRAEGVHQLLRDAHRLVPGILDCEIYEMTAKARPGSPDDVPMIGRVGDGLTVSMGYFRHGILLAAIGSRIGADIVCGTEKDNNPALLAAVNPFRFGNR